MQSGYGLNYLIDIENAAIVDVEATPARNYDEVAATKNMIERTDQRFGLKPKRLAADSAYGTGKFLGVADRRRHHSAHPGLGQKRPRGRHPATRGFPLGQAARRLHLLQQQSVAHQRHRS